MRFSSATLLLSSVGVFSTSALAAPIRVVVVEKISTDALDNFFRSIRIGHAAAAAAGPGPGPGAINGHGLADASPSTDEVHALPFPIDFGIKPEPRPAVDVGEPATKPLPMTPELEFDTFGPLMGVHSAGDCRDESSMRVKFEKLEDKIRHWLGMALISRSPLCGSEQPLLSKFEINPKKMVPPPGLVASGRMPCHSSAATAATPGMIGVHVVSTRPPMRPNFWMHRMRPQSFSGRLQRALNSLTPFESGVVAFVVGCGLGVLVRMIFVFIILGVRMWKCSKKRHDGQVQLGEEEDEDAKEIVGVVLFDAGSIKAASVDDLPLYQEKV
ncbi:SubName: Full=Uncharacterized protein {ECO:0000313/EMBL:CCA70319.1} [Serendipita indica DSM 11827]|nr:SubName: Full=Uncharacterized protein {ECO:0000313/EMBL:CCA70319.1} [Serendipita indica DSM 11827]